MSGKFPLPRRFFRCPPLSSREMEGLRALGETTASDMVRAARLESGPIKWTLTSEEDGLKIYAGDDPAAPASVVSFCGVYEIQATFDEIASLFKSDVHHALNKDHIDTQVLYKLATETPERPRHRLSIKWSATSMPGYVKPRDWCFLGGHHDFAANGRDGWVRSIKSVKLSCCPDMQLTHGVVRGEYHRSGFVFTESSRPGHLVAQIVHQVDWKGNVPSWMVASAMKKRCRTLIEFENYLLAQRMSCEVFLPLHALVPLDQRVKCSVCSVKFGAFTSKQQCRKCSEVVCRNCYKLWEIAPESSKEMQQVCICIACNAQGGIARRAVDEPERTTVSSDDLDVSKPQAEDEQPQRVSRDSSELNKSFKLHASLSSTPSSKRSSVEIQSADDGSYQMPPELLATPFNWGESQEIKTPSKPRQGVIFYPDEAQPPLSLSRAKSGPPVMVDDTNMSKTPPRASARINQWSSERDPRNKSQSPRSASWNLGSRHWDDFPLETDSPQLCAHSSRGTKKQPSAAPPERNDLILLGDFNPASSLSRRQV
ncbi:hypothetical protein LEN26_005242 [Aphanomyces euteiches]|nr:hypothetical protein AeMF1_003208 [Aphanomyces euteiches]KAH9141123.1 hypothetical protein LEN26_005242 [Aphanomyces euteiches]